MKTICHVQLRNDGKAAGCFISLSIYKEKVYAWMLHAWTETCLIISNQTFLVKTPTMHPSIQLPPSIMESVINKHLHFRKE